MLQPESVSACYFERRIEPAGMSRASESLGEAGTLDITRARDIISKQVEADKHSTGHVTVLQIMVVAGIGVDIISIARMRNSVENSGQVFLREVFTEWEQRRAELHPDCIAYFAMTFAAKEAIFKCFGIGWETGVKLKEIEIREGEFGEPAPILSGKFGQLACERGVTKVLLSLSYEIEYAVASASLIKE